jgi:hypothetical protein
MKSKIDPSIFKQTSCDDSGVVAAQVAFSHIRIRITDDRRAQVTISAPQGNADILLDANGCEHMAQLLQNAAKRIRQQQS